MKIRTATLDDAAVIARLVHAALGRYYKPARITTERVTRNLTDGKNIFLLAVDGGRAVGTIRAELIDIDLAELRWLAVDSKHRRKGVGEALVHAALDALKRRRYRKVVARSSTSNWPAVQMWLRLGFVPEGYFREHYRKGADIIQFAKFLR